MSTEFAELSLWGWGRIESAPLFPLPLLGLFTCPLLLCFERSFAVRVGDGDFSVTGDSRISDLSPFAMEPWKLAWERCFFFDGVSWGFQFDGRRRSRGRAS